MKYTKENIQGIEFYTITGGPVYMIDRTRSLPNPRNRSLVGESWKPEECIRELEKGNWKVLLWPLKPAEVNNTYSIY